MTSLVYETFKDMQDEVGRIVQDSTSTRRAVIKDAINRAYMAVALMREWPELVMVDESGLRRTSDTDIKTLESGESQVPMPPGLGLLKSLHYQTTGAPSRIEVIDQSRFYELAGSGLNTTGQPLYATVVGATAQFRKLTADGTMTVTSTSSANDNDKQVRVYYRPGTDMIGNARWENVSGSFSTGVALSLPVRAGFNVTTVVRPAGWIGSLNLTDGSGTVLVSITPTLADSSTHVTYNIVKFPLLRVWPVPDADYSLTVSWLQRPQRLFEDNDLPEIPVSAYLVERTAAEVLRQMGKSDMAGQHDREAAFILKSIEGVTQPSYSIASPPSRGNVSSQTGGARASNYGYGWYW